MRVMGFGGEVPQLGLLDRTTGLALVIELTAKMSSRPATAPGVCVYALFGAGRPRSAARTSQHATRPPLRRTICCTTAITCSWVVEKVRGKGELSHGLPERSDTN